MECKPGLPFTWMGRKHDTTHARIVREASRLFREHGTSAVGVEQVMDAASLTRGGFYAHFKNKESLVAEAITLGFEDAKTNLFGMRENEGPAWLARAASRYLAEPHIDAVGDGCIVAALGADMARADARASGAPRSVPRAAFDQGLAEVIDGIRARLGDREPARAAALFGSWVGALQLARLTPDRAVARGILAAARQTSLG